MSRAERRARKAELERAIEQQRENLLVNACRWHSAGQTLDNGWRKLRRYKVPLLAVGGLLLYRELRRPGNFMRTTGRLATGALTAKKVWRLLG